LFFGQEQRIPTAAGLKTEKLTRSRSLCLGATELYASESLWDHRSSLQLIRDDLCLIAKKSIFPLMTAKVTDYFFTQ
jgi:hypothetical protein